MAIFGNDDFTLKGTGLEAPLQQQVPATTAVYMPDGRLASGATRGLMIQKTVGPDGRVTVKKLLCR